MIVHYIKTAIRNLVRNKLYTIINVAGLSIGIAVAILLLSYCWFELSFDRFHDKEDQIYRVVQDFRIIDKETKRGGTCYELAAVLKETFPEINHVARINYYRSTQQDIEITINGKKFIESRKGENLVQADNDIFKIFDIELVQGDTETALEDPASIIITEEEVKKFYGSKNPMGELISIKRVLDEKGQNYKITGIAKKMPDNSHFEFKYMIPIGENPWTRWKFANSWTLTYLTLTEDYPTENLEKMFPELVKNYFTSGIEARFSMSYEDWKKSGGYWNLRLQALRDIHLDGQYSDSHLIKKGKITQIKIYAAIAFLIIFLACINFITLSTSQSGTRAMEVGMRKVNGASRKQLIWQFLFESVLLSLIALLVAITIVKLFSSYFNELLEIQNSFNNVGIAFILIALFLVILIVGVFSGSYPAFILSSFKPVNILYRQLPKKIGGITVRNSLVVFQFIISILLICASIFFYKQFVYMQNKDLGFDKENIVILTEMHSRLWRVYRDWTLEERANLLTSIKQELLKNPNVVDVSYTLNVQGTDRVDYTTYIVRAEGDAPDKFSTINISHIDHNYFNVFGLEMVAGQNFRKTLTVPETVEGVIINEKAVEYLGLKDPVGKHIFFENWQEHIDATYRKGLSWGKKEKVQFPIIGVFKNFHTHNLYTPIKPTIYIPYFKGDYYANDMAIKFLPGDTHSNIAFLEKIWKEMGAIQPLKFSFFDKEFDNMYKKEKRLSQIFAFFSILAVFIACLGIFGLSKLMINKRTKEIGIRKVNGATIGEIMYMLNKVFAKRVVISFVIACPLAFYLMNKWLEGFAFKTALSWWVFTLAGGITLIIALLTVSWESYKAASRNPVEALRDE